MTKFLLLLCGLVFFSLSNCQTTSKFIPEVENVILKGNENILFCNLDKEEIDVVNLITTFQLDTVRILKERGIKLTNFKIQKKLALPKYNEKEFMVRLNQTRLELQKYDSTINVELEYLVEKHRYESVEDLIAKNESLFNSTIDSIVRTDFNGKAPERKLIRIKGIYSNEDNMLFIYSDDSDISKYWSVKTEKISIYLHNSNSNSIEKIYELNKVF